MDEKRTIERKGPNTEVNYSCVTVRLPTWMVEEIDRISNNRSKTIEDMLEHVLMDVGWAKYKLKLANRRIRYWKETVKRAEQKIKKDREYEILSMVKNKIKTSYYGIQEETLKQKRKHQENELVQNFCDGVLSGRIQEF